MWKGSVFKKKLSKDRKSSKPRTKVRFATCMRVRVFFLLELTADLGINFLRTQREISLGMEIALMDIHLFYKRMVFSELPSVRKVSQGSAHVRSRAETHSQE